jgi:arylsulfatase
LISGKSGEWELYDLEADRTELNGLAAKFPTKVKELESLYQTWMKRCGVFAPEELRKLRSNQSGNDSA